MMRRTRRSVTGRVVVLAKQSIVAALVSAVLAAPAVAQELTGTLKKIKDTGTITLGVREASVPFSYYNDQQQIIGYGRDYAQLVVNALKKDLNLPNLKVAEIPVTSQNRLSLVGNGTVDLECGSTTNNTERARQVTFGDNYFVIAIQMLVRKDSGIKEWPDLVGKTVVTTAGTTDEQAIRKLNQDQKMNLNIISAKEHSEAFLILQTGRAVAFVMDDVLLYGVKTTARRPSDWVVVGTPLAKEAYACMLRKDDVPFEKFVKCRIFLNPPILTYPQEKYTINGALDNAVELIFGQTWFPQSNITSEVLPP